MEIIRTSSTNKGKGWMKCFLLFCLFAFLPFAAHAQQFRFGYLSYEQAFRMMPEYSSVQQGLDVLRGKYEDEIKRVENEFNKKYEEFLDGQRDFAPSILRKRQSELQEMMARNIAFKEESQRLLQQAEEDAMRPLYTKLDHVLSQVGRERGYAFILNTDRHAVPFVHPEMGEDVTDAVMSVLGK